MAKTEPATEVVVIDDPEQIANVLAGLTEMSVQDTSEFTAAEIHRILTSETEEEAFKEINAYNTEELENITLTVFASKLLKSTKGNGLGAFIAADVARHDTGERCIFTTSASRPAARICWLQIHGKLPRDVMVTVISEATSNGHRLYGLELVG